MAADGPSCESAASGRLDFVSDYHSMNDILAAGFRLFCKYFGVILALVLTIGLPCQLLASYVTYAVFQKQFVPAWQTSALLELVFGSVITGGILHALFVDKMGRRARFTECFSEGVRNWLPLCWTHFLVSCLITMASVLFFVPIGTWQMRIIFLLPALILGIRLSLSLTVVMTEGEWGTAALRRSVRLTADKTWQILGLCLFVYLPVQVVGFIGIGMLQTNPEWDTWGMTAGLNTVLRLVSCIIPVCFFCLYEKVIAEDRPDV